MSLQELSLYKAKLEQSPNNTTLIDEYLSFVRDQYVLVHLHLIYYYYFCKLICLLPLFVSFEKKQKEKYLSENEHFHKLYKPQELHLLINQHLFYKQVDLKQQW